MLKKDYCIQQDDISKEHLWELKIIEANEQVVYNTYNITYMMI